MIEKGDSKSAPSQHWETTGQIAFKKPVIEKMKVVEKEARKAYRKVEESINSNYKEPASIRLMDKTCSTSTCPCCRIRPGGPDRTDQHTSRSLAFPKVKVKAYSLDKPQ